MYPTENVDTDISIAPVPRIVREEILRDDIIGTCIVIAEEWPSWLTGVMAAGLDIDLVLNDARQENKKFFPQIRNNRWKSLALIEKLSITKDSLKFISGTFAFVERCFQNLEKHDNVILIEGNQPHRRSLQRLKLVEWERVKHWHCGGVTNGQFWFGWKNIGKKQTLPSQPVRYLLHIISPAARVLQTKTDPPYVVDQFQPKIVRDAENRILTCGLAFVTGVPNKIIQYVLRRLAISKVNQISMNGEALNKRLPVIEFPPDIQMNHLKAVKADNA